MADNLDPKFLDKRTAERYIRMGLLDEKAYERYVKSLPDVADKAAVVDTKMYEEEEEEDLEGGDEEMDEDEADETDEEGAAGETPEAGGTAE